MGLAEDRVYCLVSILACCKLLVLISMLFGRGNLDGVVTVLGGLGFNSWLEERCLSSPKSSDPSPLFSGYRGSFPGVKLPGSNIGHSSLFSTEVRLSGVVPPFPFYNFITLTETSLPLPTDVRRLSVIKLWQDS
jgi:hypothetical protein